jgi:hypothetical protein
MTAPDGIAEARAAVRKAHAILAARIAGALPQPPVIIVLEDGAAQVLADLGIRQMLDDIARLGRTENIMLWMEQ